MHRSRRAQGFTLLELLIVVTVIAIIIGIALPRFRGMRDEANVAKAAAELQTLQAAVESYITHQKSVPSQSTAVLTVWQSTLTAVTPQIIASALNDPFAASATQYRYATDAASNSRFYVIFSVGPDATADITSISTNGVISPAATDDDIFVSNGSVASGGF